MTILNEYVGRSGNWVPLAGGAVISPRGGGAGNFSVLLVTSDGTLSTGNTALRDLLVDDGHTVTVRALSAAEDYTGIDVIVMSYGNPLGDNGKYVHPPVGVVGVDTWRPIGMGNLGLAAAINEVEVVDAASPLAAEVTGTFAPYASPQYITWNTDLSANPDVVVTRPSMPGQAVVFGYEAGSDMLSRFATTRHVALGYHQDGFVAGLTANARAQLYAAVEWAQSSAYVAPPVPSAPTALSAAGGDTTVSLSWSSSAGADTYTVKRALVTGGPYTDIASGVTSTTYTDSTAVNDTEYFYVVSATNAAGESANSAEASATPGATERLGLHVTSAELAIWRTRWTTATADAFLDARIGQEKTRVTNNYNTFVSNPTAQLWDAPSMGTDSAGRYNTEPSYADMRNKAARVRDAAFYALIHENTAVMGQVASVLAAQPDQVRCQFATDPGWAVPAAQSMRDAAVPGFGVTHAMVTNLHTYDYIRVGVAEGWLTDPFTSAQHTKLRNWYGAWANYVEESNSWRANRPFVDRPNNNYTLTSAYADPANIWNLAPETYRNSSGNSIGPTVHRGHNLFNNRDASLARWMMLYGCAFDVQSYIDLGWRWCRDFVRYTIYPEGVLSDWHRWDIWHNYSTLQGTHVMTAVDAYTRKTGDTSLYDYETTDGMHDTAGAPQAPATDAGKSFKFLIQSYARHAKSSYSVDRWTDSHRMDYRDNRSGTGNRGMHDRFIWVNIYYQDAGLSKDWYRGENGVHPWTVTGNSTTDLNDTWAFAAPYLQWAGLEGVVWPYPGVPEP